MQIFNLNGFMKLWEKQIFESYQILNCALSLFLDKP